MAGADTAGVEDTPEVNAALFSTAVFAVGVDGAAPNKKVGAAAEPKLNPVVPPDDVDDSNGFRASTVGADVEGDSVAPERESRLRCLCACAAANLASSVCVVPSVICQTKLNRIPHYHQSRATAHALRSLSSDHAGLLYSASMDCSIRIWALPAPSHTTYVPFDSTWARAEWIAHTDVVWDLALACDESTLMRRRAW